MRKEIDHEFTDEITCPHCGDEWIDSYDFEHSMKEDLGEYTCDECGKTFVITRNIEITYSTQKKGTCEKCGKQDCVITEAPYYFEGDVCGTCWSEDYDIHKRNNE